MALAENSGRELHELNDAEFQSIHPKLSGEVRNVLTVDGALAGRTTFGGTAPSELKKQLANLESQIKSARSIIDTESKNFSEMMAS